MVRDYVPGATPRTARGEDIPALVEENGGYGWTGNDLYCNYLLSRPYSQVRISRFIPWPEEVKPRLCLLGPREGTPWLYVPNSISIVAPDKYENLVCQYFKEKRWNPLLTFLPGQVDRQVRLGNADLAVDIVYSGKTMNEENLAIYDLLFDQSGLVLLTKDI